MVFSVTWPPPAEGEAAPPEHAASTIVTPARRADSERSPLGPRYVALICLLLWHEPKARLGRWWPPRRRVRHEPRDQPRAVPHRGPECRAGSLAQTRQARRLVAAALRAGGPHRWPPRP